ncbi:MAG: NAD(P)/FAD-dependent oxidoreductase [Lachnospiraceae bacterium]|nr:NAD(P)/FAD-dependent oxidoreductase [Lachnospiraceae bacterium]
MRHKKLIIIGAGIAGYNAALRASSYGMDVALIEQYEIGGTCLNRGCIPTKTGIYIADEYRRLHESDKYGLYTRDVHIDCHRMSSYIEDTVRKLKSGVQSLLESSSVDVIHGRAELLREKRILIEGTDEIGYDNLIIATGSEPVIPDTPGIDFEEVYTTDRAFDERFLTPDDVLILGGGVIGVEFAGMYSLLGARVHIVEKQDRLLPDMDSKVSELVRHRLEEKNAHTYLGYAVSEIEREDGELIVHIRKESEDIELPVGQMLISVGRSPRQDFIGELKEDIRTENGRIITDNNHMTTADGVYAVGDVSDVRQLAYLAQKQAEDVVDYLATGRACPIYDILPRTIFFNPEMAVVGESEDSLREKGISYRMGKSLMSSNGRAVLEQSTDGYVKVILDKAGELIIGAELICPHASEIIEVIYQFIVHKIKVKDILQYPFPHPVMIETIRDAMALANRSSVR